MFRRSLSAMLLAILHIATLSSLNGMAQSHLMNLTADNGSRMESARWNERVDLVEFVAQSQSSSTSVNLAGTSWQLVKFQSSDDKTISPNDKTRYTISFGNDGRASVRLDCNQGSGTYASKGPNQLEFGRFAVTQMMCPAGSLDNRVARDLGRVRSYIIKDGHLFLSLMADGGIYEFEPLGGSNSPASDASLFGKRWRLTEITGVAVKTSKPYIEFDGDTKRFSGDGSCNRIAGSFAIDGTSLTFSQVISTRRACLDSSMQQVETNFLKGLEDTTTYKLESEVLHLYAGDRLLLTFKSDPNQTSGSQDGQVTGTVTYSQRRALPPNAIVEVKLLDVSRADAPAVTVAEQSIRSAGKQVPFSFELRYDPSRINEQGRYVIRARILVGPKLLFTNTDVYQVLTSGHGNSVAVIVRAVN